jgi:hypothetical protein
MNASILRQAATLARQCRAPLALARAQAAAAPASSVQVRCMNRNARVPTAANGKTRPCCNFLRHAKTKHLKSRSARPARLYDRKVKVDSVNAGM